MQAIYEPRGAAREYAPLACNLYRGCVHGCRYCYAPATLRMSREEFHAATSARPGILDALEKDARKLAGCSEYVLLCFTSDPYPPPPYDSTTTREALEILATQDLPVEVLTKAGLRAARDFDLLSSMRGAFGTTLLFTSDRDRAQWEPNAAPVEDRIAAIREAHGLGIPTWISVEPIINPRQAVELIETLSEVVDEWRIGKLNHHPLAATIDWATWAPVVLDAAQASGRRCMIKDALAAYLPAERRADAPGKPETARRV